MDELVTYYRKIIALLEEEYQSIATWLQGEFLDSYRDLIRKEKEDLQNKLQEILNQYY